MIIIIIIFSIYIAQINIQEDMIKYALQIKIEFEITMLPIYNFEFTITCEDVTMMIKKHYLQQTCKVYNKMENLKCYCDQIIDIHFFTFPCTI